MPWNECKPMDERLKFIAFPQIDVHFDRDDKAEIPSEAATDPFPVR